MMYKPWKKMTKDEKQACVYKKLICGLGTFLFGVIWMYFAAASDVWSGLPPTIAVMGLLMILYGLVKKFST